MADAAGKRAQARMSAGKYCEVSGLGGAVATGNIMSVLAGIGILQDGGNAFDAAARTILTQTVTEPTKFCFGGEVPIIVYEKSSGRVEVLCGQGAAPALATLDYFKSIGGIPGTAANDCRSAAVPGALHAVLTLLDTRGTMTFEEVARPMVRLLAMYKSGWQADLKSTVDTLVAADVRARAAGGDRHAGIMAAMGEFYGRDGAVARRLSAWCEANGGLIRVDDLAAHKTRVEEPVSSTYRGYTVYKCGPWTQGPYLLETLNILEGFDLAAMGQNSPECIHVMTEAMKLGLADRDMYFADPWFAQVPLAGIVSKEYAALRRTLIDPKRASLEIRPGDPARMRALAVAESGPAGPNGDKNDTTTCIVADRWGNIVVATPSGWGGALAGDTGIWLGSRLSSLNTWQGHPNVVAPGKRPRITLTPTLVFKDGAPFMAVSVAGGDAQDQVALNLLVDVIDFGFSPAEAVTCPRFGTAHMTSSFSQEPPKLGSIEINSAVGEAVIDELKARGHDVTPWNGSYWTPSVMTFDAGTGLIRAAGDPGAGRRSGAF